MAETYGVLDVSALPLTLFAALAAGLREDSRVMMQAGGREVPGDTLLMAAAVDRLTWLCWAKTKHAARGTHRPESLVERLTGGRKKQKAPGFTSGADFEAWKRGVV